MINGSCFKNAVISGANNILNNKKLVDDLNIFPVPDGDTGTNMSMTITSAFDVAQSESIGEVSKAIASAMLRGARGNSGVILSILFRGISQGLEKLEQVDGESLVRALGLGVEAAYKAVMNPTEGTILTVARVAFEEGLLVAELDKDPELVWSAVCEGANKALEKTPELLPVLKKAGVVDAGGKGLCLIFEGMLSVFKNNKIIEYQKIDSNDVRPTNDVFESAAAAFDDDINFTYCTEFIVGRDKKINTPSLKLREFLETIGDCVVVVDDEEIIKVHVHTEDPGLALQEALKFGALLTVKVENMKEQHKNAGQRALNSKSATKEKFEWAEPSEEFGFVCVAAGDGVKNLFLELGCTRVVTGGQTMNPSTEDILEAVNSVPAKVVYVLPNNKNILLAAEQAVNLAKDRRVVIIPTRTIPQGLSAMMAFDPDASVNQNTKLMEIAFKKVSTGQVTFAARNSEYGGFKMKKDDIIALDNGKLVSVGKDPVKSAFKLARSMIKNDTMFVTLIYGEGISQEEAERAKQMLSAKVGNRVDITLVEGNQPVYYFIISVE